MENEIIVKNLVDHVVTGTKVQFCEVEDNENHTARVTFKGNIEDTPYRLLNREAGDIFITNEDNEIILNIILCQWIINE